MIASPGSTLRRQLARFAFCASLLSVLLVAFGDRFEDALMPWFGLTLRIVDPAHEIQRLALYEERSGRVIQLTVKRVHYVFVGGRALEPHPTATASASTLVGSVRLSGVLALAAAFAQPAISWLGAGLRVLLACLAALLCLALDIPLLLASEIEGLYLRAHQPSAGSPLIAWSNFMLDGGRLAVPLVLGYLAGHGATIGLRPQTAAQSL